MNVENINFAQFLDYFNTWYPVLVPAALLSIILLGCIVDWIRVLLVGYVDDNENDVKHWWWHKVKSVFGIDVYYGTKYEGSDYYYWVKLPGYFAGFRDKAEAKRYAAGDETVTPACVHDSDLMSNLIDTKVFFGPIMPIVVLSVVLLVIKLLPLVIVAGVAIGYGTLRLARSVVRLTKKFKAHVSNPNAHKEK